MDFPYLHPIVIDFSYRLYTCFIVVGSTLSNAPPFHVYLICIQLKIYICSYSNTTLI
jgi:hypothetical protein